MKSKKEKWIFLEIALIAMLLAGILTEIIAGMRIISNFIPAVIFAICSITFLVRAIIWKRILSYVVSLLIMGTAIMVFLWK